jgi:hypothetical protein
MIKSAEFLSSISPKFNGCVCPASFSKNCIFKDHQKSCLTIKYLCIYVRKNRLNNQVKQKKFSLYLNFTTHTLSFILLHIKSCGELNFMCVYDDVYFQ